ncbi:tetratricopeptide repeat protein [Candidatus Poribacteria bacterium]|nr:tetratricopeptide repeat protein [Candidatus Poribacteria bacterium]
MDIRIYQNNDKMLVQLSGRVVLDECDRLKGAVVPRIVPGVSQVNLDLSHVDFIDSAGLGVLVGMKVSSNKSRARLALISPSKGVSDILLVSKLDSIFDIMTGAEGDAIVASLARENFLVTGEQSAQAPAASQPGFQAPPAPATAPVGGTDRGMSAKDQIDQLCKNAVEYMRRRDYDQAAECYRKAIEIDPNYLPAHNNLGIVYEKKPQWNDLAIKQWERVLKLSKSRGDMKHVERAQKHLDDLLRA